MEGLLFNNFDDIKRHVSAVNGDFSEKTIESYIRNSLAEIRLMLGNELLSELISGFDDNNLTDELKALHELVQKPLANMAFYKFSNAGSIRITDSGLTAEETETTKRPYQWQIRNFQKQCLDDYSSGMEDLWSFLTENMDDYTGWELTEEYLWLQQRPINLTSEWAKSGRRISGWRTHYALLSEMTMVWDDLAHKISQPLWDELNTELLEGLSEENSDLLKYIQRYVAHATIERAAITLPVVIDADGILIKEVASSSSNSETIKQENDRISIKRNAGIEAEKALCRLLNFLNSNATADKYSGYYETFLENPAQNASLNDPTSPTIFM